MYGSGHCPFLPPVSLYELKKQARKDLESKIYSELEAGQRQPDSAVEGSLSQFFQEVSMIKLEMEDISNLLLDLRALNEESKSALSAKVLRGLRDRMKSDSISVQWKAVSVKTRLHSLDRSNATSHEGAAVGQTRASVTNGLRTKLAGMMRDFQALREKINSDRKEELRRRYFNSTGEEPSEEMIEKMMASVSVSSSFSRPGEKKIEFLDGKEKEMKDDHKAGMEIHRSLEKLHQIFLDMAVIVEAQGEKVDEIKDNVASGGWYVSGGTDSLYYANQMNKKNKNWVRWVGLVVLIILLVYLVSLFAS
ncbi:hypothetical protein CDL15_Pgr005198 [Punica granatum]|uniref:t-SNARE coiled-coil homology domain-containing protein n=2 Tax=Punica granatum TaxID=22663 RepID=A0A218WQ73_PUNGR|nr:hypothetical protein CDL15_Pgr005198 [Punica granatum]